MKDSGKVAWKRPKESLKAVRLNSFMDWTYAYTILSRRLHTLFFLTGMIENTMTVHGRG